MTYDAALNWLLARLQEQSTWRGIILLLTSLGIYLKPEQVAAITTVGLAVVGLINVFRNEQKQIAAVVQTTLAAQPKKDP